MIDGHIEEALDLVGMEVHGDQTVDACHTQQVSHELGCD